MRRTNRLYPGRVAATWIHDDDGTSGVLLPSIQPFINPKGRFEDTKPERRKPPVVCSVPVGTQMTDPCTGPCMFEAIKKFCFNKNYKLGP